MSRCTAGWRAPDCRAGRRPSRLDGCTELPLAPHARWSMTLRKHPKLSPTATPSGRFSRKRNMVIDAIELLNEHGIVHPSRIVSSSMEDGEFCLSIVGYPWWRDEAGDAEGKISFRFSGVTNGNLDLRTL